MSPDGQSAASLKSSILGNKRKKDSPTSVLGENIEAKSKKPKVVPYFWAPANKKTAAVARAKQQVKISHTGSGVPMSQVMRLKYTKGFTQAVRVPCRLDDLA
jgi:chromosome transmission fidelity protein 18